jgi:hypothetical protein
MTINRRSRPSGLRHVCEFIPSPGPYTGTPEQDLAAYQRHEAFQEAVETRVAAMAEDDRLLASVLAGNALLRELAHSYLTTDPVAAPLYRSCLREQVMAEALAGDCDTVANP